MTDKQFSNERAYMTCLSILHDLRDKGLMTDDEYRDALAILREKFHPIVGSLFD